MPAPSLGHPPLQFAAHFQRQVQKFAIVWLRLLVNRAARPGAAFPRPGGRRGQCEPVLNPARIVDIPLGQGDAHFPIPSQERSRILFPFPLERGATK